MTLQVGIIGLGQWGLNIYKTIIKNFPKVKIVALQVKTGKLLKKIDKKCNVYKDIDLMLRKEKLDCVFVAVPPKFNMFYFKKIVKKKIPLFIEKPLALNMLTIKNMKKISKKNLSLIHVNHIDLFNVAIKKLNTLINDLIAAEFRIITSAKSKAYISPMLDLTPHFIAVSITFTREMPRYVLVKKQKIYQKFKDRSKRQMVSLNLFFKKKIITIIAGNGSKIKERNGKIITRDKIFYYDNPLTGKNILKFSNIKGSRTLNKIKLKKTPSLTSSISYFLNNVRKKKKNTKDLYLSEKVLKVQLAAEKSLFSGRLVKIG